MARHPRTQGSHVQGETVQVQDDDDHSKTRQGLVLGSEPIRYRLRRWLCNDDIYLRRVKGTSFSRIKKG